MRLLTISIFTVCFTPSIFAAAAVTPEPGTALLLGAGLVAVAVGSIVRRKNRKK